MQEGYDWAYYFHVTKVFHIPSKYKNFSIGCIFTILSLGVTVIFAIVIHNTIEKDIRNMLCKCINYIYVQCTNLYERAARKEKNTIEKD